MLCTTTVSPSRTKLEQRFELGALGVLARCLVGEHLAHLGLFQLAFRVLVRSC